jgi:hypothetical protein
LTAHPYQQPPLRPSPAVLRGPNRKPRASITKANTPISSFFISRILNVVPRTLETPNSLIKI